MAWDDEIWRGRFRDYSPLQLERFAREHPDSDTARIALEVLDEKLIKAGYKPNR